MNSVLILYPPQFLSGTKFFRKIENIVSRMHDFCIVCQDDPNQFIRNFCEKYPKKILINSTKDWRSENITHAIVFDDGEEFNSDIKFLEDLGLPLRIVRIAITRVVNIKKDIAYSKLKSTSHYEYIGRGSYWGNPYSMFTAGESREEVIRKFKYDFDFDKFAKKNKSEVYKLAGKRLGCFCKPDACHGDVLAEFLNEWDDGE